MLSRSMLSRRTLAAVAAAALAGCGDIAEQLQADNFAVAALVKTPDQENPQTKDVIPGVTALTVYFASVDKSKIVSGVTGESAQAGALKANTGATVSLDFTGSDNVPVTINIPDKGEGKYAIDSKEAAKLAYHQTKYTLNISYSGSKYVLAVDASAPAMIKEFKGKAVKVITEHPAGQAFTITRDVAQGPAKNPLAFVALSAADGESSSETYSNFPKDAFGFLQFVLDDTQWRQDSYTIPGTNFAANKPYLAALMSVERGTPTATSAALFVGSSFLAGVADAGGIVTK